MMKRISSILGLRQIACGAFLYTSFISLSGCQHDIPELDGQPKVAVNQKVEKHPFLVEDHQRSPTSINENKGDNE